MPRSANPQNLAAKICCLMCCIHMPRSFRELYPTNVALLPIRDGLALISRQTHEA
jgi:hypothetical protein